MKNLHIAGNGDYTSLAALESCSSEPCKITIHEKQLSPVDLIYYKIDE